MKRKQLKIILEKSNDSYSAYAENIHGVYGQGNTIDETKQSALEGLALFKKYNRTENIPAILKGEYEIVFCSHRVT